MANTGLTYQTLKRAEESLCDSQLPACTAACGFSSWSCSVQDSAVGVGVAPLSLRCTFPQEMADLLAEPGFTVVEQYGDWNLSPLTDNKIGRASCRERV